MDNEKTAINRAKDIWVGCTSTFTKAVDGNVASVQK